VSVTTVAYDPLPDIPPVLVEMPEHLFVEGDLAFRDQTVGPVNSVIVERGACLTLENVDLRMVGPGGVSVDAGASLLVLNSRIGPPTPEQGGIFFNVDPDARFEIRDSEVVGVGVGLGIEEDGIYVLNSNAVIENNTFTDCSHGLRLAGDGHRVSGNTMILCGTGIGEEWPRPTNSRIVGNTISHCWDGGIWMITAGLETDVTVHRNVISDVWRVAIGVGQDHVISNNLISDVLGDGIRLQKSPTDCTVSGNRVERVTGRALMAYGSGSEIVGNTFADSGVGMDLATDGTVVYHNNFIDNQTQAMSCCENQWDNGAHGNFWSDYQWQDLDGDGIGDVPHEIGFSSDRYPLMVEYGPGSPPRRPSGRESK